MKYRWLAGILVGTLACGGDGGGTPTPDGNGSGTPDAPPSTAFCDGTTKHPIGPSSLVRRIAVDGSGRLLVMGYETQPMQVAFVRRYLADGSPDPAYGTGGVARSSNRVDPHDFLVHADGSVVVVGGDVTGADAAPLVFSLDASGQPGTLTYTEPVQAEDRRAGWIGTQGDAYIIEIEGYLYRLLANGQLDPAFGTMNGAASTGFDPVATRSDGFVVASRQGFDLTARRLTEEGSAVVNSLVTFTGLDADSIVRIDVQDDRATIVGDALREGTIGTHDIYIARLDASGALDATYGTNGHVTLNLTDPNNANDAAVLPDGSVLLTGLPHLARIKPDGTLLEMRTFDFTFGRTVAVWGEHWVVTGQDSSSSVLVCGPL